MVRAPQITVDPARDTAAVLRRIGVLVLMIGLPVAALAARTGPVFAFAIGTVLLAAAAVFDGAWRPVRDAALGVLTSPAFLAGSLVAAWAVLSLAWTPAPRSSGTAVFGIAAILGLGLVGFLALPDRMRSANLYPIPIGAAITAFLSIALAAGAGGEGAPEVARRLERGLAILVLFAWPAVGWLRSRGRDGEAVGLALVVAAAAAFGPSAWPALALAAGALAYLAAQLLDRGAVGLGILFASLLILAPLLLALAGPVLPVTAFWQEGVAAWRHALLDEPLRLLTGRGLGALRSAEAARLLPPVFGTPVLALWYELGIVGVAGSAVAIVAALRRAGASFGPLLPGVAASVATAILLGLAGADGGALWWPASLAAVAVVLVATQRGQFRTRRPRALGLGRTRPA